MHLQAEAQHAPPSDAGLTPALAGSGLAWGIYFFAYNRAKVINVVMAAVAGVCQPLGCAMCIVDDACRAPLLPPGRRSICCFSEQLVNTAATCIVVPLQERYQRASGQTKLSPGWHLVSAAEAGSVVSGGWAGTG